MKREDEEKVCIHIFFYDRCVNASVILLALILEAFINRSPKAIRSKVRRRAYQKPGRHGVAVAASSTVSPMGLEERLEWKNSNKMS